MTFAKRKGSEAERKVAQIFREEGIDKTCTRQPLSGASIYKGDLKTSCGYSVEIKKQESLNIWKSIKQAESQAIMEHQPFLLIFGRNNTPFYVVMDIYDWCSLYKKAQQKPSADNPNRELSYALNQLKLALNRVIKLTQ